MEAGENERTGFEKAQDGDSMSEEDEHTYQLSVNLGKRTVYDEESSLDDILKIMYTPDPDAYEWGEEEKPEGFTMSYASISKALEFSDPSVDKLETMYKAEFKEQKGVEQWGGIFEAIIDCLEN